MISFITVAPAPGSHGTQRPWRRPQSNCSGHVRLVTEPRVQGRRRRPGVARGGGRRVVRPGFHPDQRRLASVWYRARPAEAHPYRGIEIGYGLAAGNWTLGASREAGLAWK